MDHPHGASFACQRSKYIARTNAGLVGESVNWH